MNKIGRSWSFLSEIKVGVGLEELELFCVEAAGFYSHCCARKNFLESKINSDTFICLQPTHCRKEVSPIIPVSTFSFASPLSFFSLRSILSFLLLLCLLLDRRQETGFELFQVSATYKVTVYIDWSSTIFFLLTRYQSKISGIGVTPLTSSTVHWHTQSQRRHSSKFTKAYKVGLHLCLLSPSGLTPWRVPAGDVVAGQLPGRGSSGKMALSSRSFAGVETCVLLRAS